MKDNRDNFDQNINNNPNLDEMPVEVSEDFVNAYIDATKMNAPDLWSRIDAGFDNELKLMNEEQENVKANSNIYNFNPQNVGVNAPNTIDLQSESNASNGNVRKSFNSRKWGLIAAGLLAIVIAVPVLSNISSNKKSESENSNAMQEFFAEDAEVKEEITQAAESDSADVYFAGNTPEAGETPEEDENSSNYSSDKKINADSERGKISASSDWNVGSFGVETAESAATDGIDVLASLDGEFEVVQEDDGIYISVVDVIYLEEDSKIEDSEIKNNKYMIANSADYENMCKDKGYSVITVDDTMIGVIHIYLEDNEMKCVITSIK